MHRHLKNEKRKTAEAQSLWARVTRGRVCAARDNAPKPASSVGLAAAVDGPVAFGSPLASVIHFLLSLAPRALSAGVLAAGLLMFSGGPAAAERVSAASPQRQWSDSKCAECRALVEQAQSIARITEPSPERRQRVLSLADKLEVFLKSGAVDAKDKVNTSVDVLLMTLDADPFVLLIGSPMAQLYRAHTATIQKELRRLELAKPQLKPAINDLRERFQDATRCEGGPDTCPNG